MQHGQDERGQYYLLRQQHERPEARCQHDITGIWGCRARVAGADKPRGEHDDMAGDGSGENVGTAVNEINNIGVGGLVSSKQFISKEQLNSCTHL